MLLALAVVITVPGRHGQRPLNAALLGATGAGLVFWGLRGAVHPWVPGAAAIVAAVLLALFGLVAVGWATAFPTAGGHVRVRYGSQLPRSIALWLLAGLWVAALWITRKRVER